MTRQWTMGEAVTLALIGAVQHRNAEQFLADLQEYGYVVVAVNDVVPTEEEKGEQR